MTPKRLGFLGNFCPVFDVDLQDSKIICVFYEKLHGNNDHLRLSVSIRLVYKTWLLKYPFWTINISHFFCPLSVCGAQKQKFEGCVFKTSGCHFLEMFQTLCIRKLHVYMCVLETCRSVKTGMVSLCVSFNQVAMLPI